MKKLIKKIKKIMAEIDKIEAKEETLREDLSEAIDELDEENND
jgi:nucleoside diphosphate kinase